MAELKPQDYIITLTPNAYSAKDGGKVVFSATNIRPFGEQKGGRTMDEIANAIRDVEIPLWGIFVTLGLLLWVIVAEMGGKK